MNNSQLYFNKDADLSIIKNKTVGVIGFGNQGRAQALNLIDRGISVKIGLRKSSKSISYLESNNIKYDDIDRVVKEVDVICMLISDKSMPSAYDKYIKNNLKDGQTLLFSHGYNIHYKFINPPNNINVVMVAPSGGGAMVRESFKNNSGIPNLLAVHHDYSGNSLELIKSYSRAIGGTRICAFMSTFKEETETDLFGEQAILTGGLPAYINKTLKVMLESGYSPIVSWFVCYYELKTIVDLFHDKGFEYLYDSISDTAKYGGLTRGDYIVDDKMEDKLKKVLYQIKNKSFIKEHLNASDEINYSSPFDKKNTKIFDELLKIVYKNDKK